MSEVTVSPTKRHWTPPLRFSLRVWLAAFTVLAIGFPIWYRWPYERHELLSAAGSTPKVERATTWQRQWGGQILKHGPERRLVNGQLSELTNYAFGQKHGYYARHDANGKAEVWGQFLGGQKDGVWVEKDSGITRTSTWRLGKLDGAYDITTASGQKLELLFVEGRLTHFNGRPAVNRLYDLLEDGTLDATVEKQLRSVTSYSIRAGGLHLALDALKAKHGISFVIDRRVLSGLPAPREIDGLDLCSALTQLTAPHGLGCDYRHGCIWITPAEAALNWHDETGVSRLLAANNRALARVWNYRFDIVEAQPRPLAEVLEEFSVPLRLYIDTSQLPPAESQDCPMVPTMLLEKERLESILGILLEHSGARCQATPDALAILPPKTSPAVRDGPYVVCGSERGVTLHYRQGELERVDGRSVSRRKLAGADPKVAAVLRRIMSLPVEFVQTPLRDAIQFLSDSQGIQIQLDPRLRRSRIALTISQRGIEFESALGMLTAAHGLGYDYRYGSLWITTADDANDWHDPTGVCELVPPPGSKLVQAWVRPTLAEFVETPLTDALQYLSDSSNVSINAPPDYRPTA